LVNLKGLLGVFNPKNTYFQVNTKRLLIKYNKEEEQLLNDYYAPFSNHCDIVAHELSTQKNMKLKRLGWLILNQTYDYTSPRGHQKVKVKTLGYQTFPYNECSGSELYAYYELDLKEDEVCGMISNQPLKYPKIKALTEIKIENHQEQVSKIKQLIVAKLNTLTTRAKEAKKQSLTALQNYKIYEIAPHQFYVVITVENEEQNEGLHFILYAHLEKNTLALIDEYFESYRLNIRMECQIDRNQDGKYEIPVIYDGYEWQFEKEIIDHQIIEDDR
jgi:hypothetical protein